jgi:hypothetical protein
MQFEIALYSKPPGHLLKRSTVLGETTMVLVNGWGLACRGP